MSGISVAKRCDLVDDILNASDGRFSRVDEYIVSTRSNLNFEVFTEICRICGVSIEPFSGDASFIDLVMLRRRNAIAHGEDTLAGLDDLDKRPDRTIGLMRMFGNALENRIYLRSFMAA